MKELDELRRMAANEYSTPMGWLTFIRLVAWILTNLMMRVDALEADYKMRQGEI